MSYICFNNCGFHFIDRKVCKDDASAYLLTCSKETEWMKWEQKSKKIKKKKNTTNERKQRRLKVIEVNIQPYYLLFTFISSTCFSSSSIEIFMYKFLIATVCTTTTNIHCNQEFSSTAYNKQKDLTKITFCFLNWHLSLMHIRYLIKYVYLTSIFFFQY